MRIASGEAPARVALAGNPSDGYGGRVVSLAIENFSARATVREWPRVEIVPAAQDHVRFASVDDLVSDVRANGYYGGLRLVKAAIKRFAEISAELGAPVGERTFSIRYETDIPRAVGLGGSSAIVIATIRALLQFEGLRMDPDRLAELALAVETNELGIAAGLQDRVAQAFGGLTFMDFNPALEDGASRYGSLDPALLPPLFVAYLADAGEPSELPHAELRRRWHEGDPEIVGAMEELGELGSLARSAICDRDHEGLGAAIDATFEVRRRVTTLDPRHVDLVDRARALGCSANYTGSGGAIVGTYRDADHLRRIEAAVAAAGGRVAPCRPAAQIVHNWAHSRT